ncbi:MAG: kynureninase [Opitutaceae bacterium]|nr:kynureninase [Cytophagales bacterium]
MFLKPLNNNVPIHYFCGHSLGLQPEITRLKINAELEKWALYGVEGHFESPDPWFSYHHTVKKGLAELCGAKESEVNANGSLTSNIHNLFASFYNPTKEKYKILTEDIGFSSDNFAMQTQVQFHGYQIEDAIVFLEHNENYCFDTDYIIEQIEKHKNELSIIWLSVVNFLSGQVLNLELISNCAAKYNIKVGVDLAHAIGNIPLKLHTWGVDFAVWCSYKYLNAGPGATGGYFVHEKNFPQSKIEEQLATHNSQLTTILGGWWGHKEETRFQTGISFDPVNNADAWLHSNANVLSLSALRASLEIFLSEDIHLLSAKSKKQTIYAFDKFRQSNKIKILTPEKQAGNMISIQVLNQDKSLVTKLKEQNILVDWREPGIMRFSFCPLYNEENEWKHFIDLLNEML